MPLDEIPGGVTVFLDSTILHYAFVYFEAATPQCVRLLKRVRARELGGSITIPVLNDAVHKVMCSEAVERFQRPRAGLVAWMKRNSAAVKQLTFANDLLGLIETLPIQILAADVESLAGAQQIVSSHGLLANDALIISMMQRHGLGHLATNDDDFDHVAGITVWKPR
jgi:predicted nucleic acid-binding protein